MRTTLLVAAIIAAVVLPAAFHSSPAGEDRPRADAVRFAPFGPACVKVFVAGEVTWVGTWPEMPWGALRNLSGRGDAVPGGFGDGNGRRRPGVEVACAPSSLLPPSPPPS